MAWSRVALLHAASENDSALEAVAAVFDYHKAEAARKKKQGEGSKSSQTSQAATEQAIDKKEVSQRPPARFVRVTKFIEHHPEDTPRPDYLSDPGRKLSGEAVGSYDFPEADVLLPASRLLPFLLTNLGVAQESLQLNHSLIAKRMGQGKALQRLPYVKKRRWPKRIHVIVDAGRHLEPYWKDFKCIIKDLESVLGKEAVNAFTIDENTLDDETPYCTPWPMQADDLETEWVTLSSNDSVLVLSDLGVAAPGKKNKVRWRRFANRHLQQAEVLTLSPASESPGCPKTARCIRPNPLHDTKQSNHASHRGFTSAPSAEWSLHDVLTLLSALPLVDAALLRKLRQQLHLGNSALEAQVWNHKDMISTGLGICINPANVEPYRQRYQRLFARTEVSEQLWEIVNEHHRDSYKGLKEFESFSQTALEGQAKNSAISYMRSLAASLAQADSDSSEHDGLVMQCKSILMFCPDSLATPELSDLAHELLTVAYKEEIENEDWEAVPLANVQLDKVHSIRGKSNVAEMTQWEIVLNHGPQTVTLKKKRGGGFRLNYPPILEFTTQQGLPVTIRSGDHPNHVIEDSMTFKQDVEKQTIESSTSLIELDSIRKPSWATAIGNDQQGLWASFDWNGKPIRLDWCIVDGVGKWKVGYETAPSFGVDQYGLYTDLLIARGQTQRFRWIEPGTFQMGSPETEPERMDNETQHQVTLSQGYWLADTTVTQAQWQAITGETPSRFKGENLPVEQVSWDDSQAFIKKLKQIHPDFDFQLPSEAQWEYACRAGTTTPFSFGENITSDQVNYYGRFPYNNSSKDEYRERTVAVKSLPCNPWGLYEMHGNVFEWCKDSWWDDLGSEASIDPKAEGAGAERVVRGGSWSSIGRDVRSACRLSLSPGVRDFSLGFRLSFGQPSGSSRGGAAQQVSSRPAASTASRVAEQRQAGLGGGLLGGVQKFAKKLFGSKDEK